MLLLYLECCCADRTDHDKLNANTRIQKLRSGSAQLRRSVCLRSLAGWGLRLRAQKVRPHGSWRQPGCARYPSKSKSLLGPREDGVCSREQKLNNKNIVKIAHAPSGEVFTSLQRPLPVRGAVVEPPKTPRSGIPKGRPTTTGTRGPWDSFDPGYRRRQRIAKVLGAAAARRGYGEHGDTPTPIARMRSET